MLECAAETGVTFTMASKFRYVQDAIQAKSLLASGVLGEVVQFENAFTAESRYVGALEFRFEC